MEKRAISLNDFRLKNVSPVIRFLILGDVVYYAGVGLLGPIFALFIVDTIQGGSAEIAGIAIAIYLLTKSIMQIPAGYIIDKICGERDDFWFMFIGLLAASILQFLYLFVSTPMELFIVQFLLGIALAFNFPSFMALFTKHISEKREATLWSIYYTLFDLLTAGAAAIGGILAVIFGFKLIILIGSIVGIIGALLLLPIRDHLRSLNC
jgi:MFS family permease